MFGEEMIKVLDYLGQKLGVAIDWSNQNALPYLEELAHKYINYEIATSIVWLIIGILILTLSIFLFRKREKGVIDDYTSCSALCFVGAGTIIFFQVMDIIKCIFLPELQIYEYLQYLMK